MASSAPIRCPLCFEWADELHPLVTARGHERRGCRWCVRELGQPTRPEAAGPATTTTLAAEQRRVDAP